MIQGLVLLSLMCVLSPVLADIYTFNNKELVSGSMHARSLLMYNLHDSPSGSTPPYIQVAMTFEYTDTGAPDSSDFIEVIVIENGALDFREDIGQMENGKKVYCDSTGSLIVRVDTVRKVQAKFTQHNNKWIAQLAGDDKRFAVSQTGLHTLVISNCNSFKVIANGNSMWMNPYGYLPGQLFGYLRFYSRISVIFLGVAAVWFGLSMIHWRELYMLQMCISVVLGLCLIEMTMWYFDYSNYNSSGVRHPGVFIIGSIVSVMRRALSRMLVICVSLGYGVVRLTLGDNRSRILWLGVLYFGFGSVLELIMNYGQTEEVDKFWRFLFTLPVAAIDAYCYWWIFISLYQLMTTLKARKQNVKLQLYKYFFVVLVGSLASALGFAFYQMHYYFTNSIETQWQKYWLVEHGFWQILYAALLFMIMGLWRPNKDSRRYVYTELNNKFDDDDDFTEDLELRHRENGFGDGDVDDEPEPLFEIGDGDDEDDDLVLDTAVIGKMS